jgi:hypothetical protein
VRRGTEAEQAREGQAGKGGAQATQGNGQQSHHVLCVYSVCAYVCLSCLRKKSPRRLRLSFFEFFHRRRIGKASSSSSSRHSGRHTTHAQWSDRKDERASSVPSFAATSPSLFSSRPPARCCRPSRPALRVRTEQIRRRPSCSLQHTAHSNDKGRRQLDNNTSAAEEARARVQRLLTPSGFLVGGFLLSTCPCGRISEGSALKGAPRDRQA